jgi:hypothetical protein
MNTSLKLFQIYYNEITKAQVEPGFIGLDNTSGPSWAFEAHPIYEFLSTNILKLENQWLGFFSPKFREKTNVGAGELKNAVQRHVANTDVFLISSFWEQAAGSLNVWQHGEFHHPGLLEISQTLADEAGYDIDLKTSTTTFETAVFSNYLIATADFWKEWHRVVGLYLKNIKFDKKLRASRTEYLGGILPIHTFVIERVASMILLGGKFRSSYELDLYQKSNKFPPFLNRFIIQMDQSKRLYCNTKDPVWLRRFEMQCKKFNLSVCDYQRAKNNII